MRKPKERNQGKFNGNEQKTVQKRRSCQCRQTNNPWGPEKAEDDRDAIRKEGEVAPRGKKEWNITLDGNTAPTRKQKANPWEQRADMHTISQQDWEILEVNRKYRKEQREETVQNMEAMLVANGRGKGCNHILF